MSAGGQPNAWAGPSRDEASWHVAAMKYNVCAGDSVSDLPCLTFSQYSVAHDLLHEAVRHGCISRNDGLDGDYAEAIQI